MPESVAGAGAGTTPWWQTDSPPRQAEAVDPYGKDTFLKLLVAQMRYQNPMSPMDGTEFISQTAQFTMVEKMNDVAANTKDIAATQGILQAAALVGRTVSYVTIAGESRSGVVSSARFTDIGPVLRVGSDDVPLTHLLSVTQSTPSTPSTDPGTDPGTDPTTDRDSTNPDSDN